MLKHLLSALLAVAAAVPASAQTSYSGTVVADEGAWCWFADPRAIHYADADAGIDATYLGYIDVHGNVKATQYDHITGHKTDVLIRSYFQPDDHNNPTFVVLPDRRVMIFYTRHTDEPKIWYRISRRPGDITALGEEKYLSTANNTTYPSPFILSDDPEHIYLCWRGINWHPTLARLTMPDENDDCHFDFGPKQLVQSTGARPYAKYQSNGKDKIYVAYTTGHPDNEMPDWLYFNVIDINHGNGPILRDITGMQLSVVANGVFNVSKQSSYASAYPATIVDNTDNIRNWVWQIALDSSGNPVIAYPHIDSAKTTHVYWYARWTGTQWRRTWVQYGGHAFHQNWNSTELCYSGGMALDPDDIHQLYLSIPTINGAYNKDGVYEIWRYTIDDNGTVTASTQITRSSAKNNVRPFVLPGSTGSPIRLAWMSGDYYYWIVKQGYPKGYPTGIRMDAAWDEQPLESYSTARELRAGTTLTATFAMDEANYSGTLLRAGDDFTYSLDAATQCPVITIGTTSYMSTNRLLTSDDWATMSTGTSGDNHPTKVTTWVLTLTYDGQRLISYRNGLADQVIETTSLQGGEASVTAADGTPSPHTCLSLASMDVATTPFTVQKLAAEAAEQMAKDAAAHALAMLSLPAQTRTDIVLPSQKLSQAITWTTSDASIISATGTLAPLTQDAVVTLTASTGGESRSFDIVAKARDIEQNARYSLPEALDLSANTAAGFATNTYGLAPEGLLQGLRSYTVLLTATAADLASSPRFYDFGSASGNSLFLRAQPLSAGIKLNGGTTTMVTSSTALQAGRSYQIAVSYNAATHTTRIYLDGEEVAAGQDNTAEPYQLYEVARDTRNYIGRTQWWDTNYKADNVDLRGTVEALTLYDVCLSRREICGLQNLPFEQKELPSQLLNGDFEGTYSVQAGSGVSSDRAIYVPEGWTVTRTSPDQNDITALRAGDKYYSNFFASLPAPDAASTQTYWIRQNWGTPTLTLAQELRLPAGLYTLSADLWKSGLGGDATVAVTSESGLTLTTATMPNLTEWQHLSLDFASDGDASTTIQLIAAHNSAGSEKIIGWDNVAVTTREGTAVTAPRAATSADAVYDLAGRRVTRPAAHGIYIRPAHGKAVR